MMTESLSNLPDYPFDLFSDENEYGQVTCLVDTCDKTFDTREKYLDHLLYNTNHFNYIKRNLMAFEAPQDMGEEIVFDPIEQAQIEWNIKNNVDYAALKYGVDVTHLLLKKIAFSVKYNRNIIAEIIGIPGAGKSYATIALGYLICGLWADKLDKITELNLDFELAKILEMITDHNPGDCLIQDEDPRGFGAGVRTNEEAFENLAKTLRKRRISMLVVSPVETLIKNKSFVVEFIAYYPKTRITKGVLYTRKKRALGYIFIEILDDEDYIEYEEMKDAFIDKMQLSGGFGVDNYDEERIAKDFEILMNSVVHTDPRMPKGRITGRAKVIVKGDGGYQAMIADDVFYHLKTYGPPDDAPKPTRRARREKFRIVGKNYFEAFAIKTNGGAGTFRPKLPSLIHKHSKPMNRDQILGLGWFWGWYCDHENPTQGQITDRLNEEHNENMSTTAYVKKFVNKFTTVQQCWGDAVELAVQELLYPEYERQAGIGEPDLVNNDSIEIKIRGAKNTRAVLYELEEQSYIWDLIMSGADVKLIYVVYAAHYDFHVFTFQLTGREATEDELELWMAEPPLSEGVN